MGASAPEDGVAEKVEGADGAGGGSLFDDAFEENAEELEWDHCAQEEETPGGAGGAVGDFDGVGAKDFDTGESTITITLEFWQIVMIGFWIVITMVVTNFFGQSRFILLLQWMLVNWPLLAILASIVFDDDTTIFQGQSWIWKLLLVVEILTLACFVTINYLYPWFVGSPWFRENIGPQRMWDVQTNSQHNWTLTYDGKYGKR
eukprot:CAMPEP_0198300774 /NCGR_PEP_ID=MMETSP1449-20131203/49458_1 /TAXON_ID=420275 /ORGANISM="Attheya septentrionalis, Strain CCMP2084" /LENGTH=202 /DNA_ID=CAMNT_0044002685 /DNA_START=97 /DNA_END=702 /DNA_ORIENTATION=+